MIRRKPRSELVVAAQPGGVVVQGPRALTDGFTERLMAVVRSPEFAHAGVAVGAIRSALDRASDSGSVYFEFSPRAMALLEQHGAIPTGDGFFRSMVHDGSQFAGNLDWRSVKPGPELVQLQTMAVGLALQASLAELAAAVERVEDKIDHLTDRIRSFQVGEVIAHHRVLSELVASVDDGHPIGDTDWSSIEHLRTEIVANIDGARGLLRSPISRAEPGWTAAGRAAVSQRLIDDDFVDTLGLLAVCEHNLAAWHRVRVERVRRSEPDHLERTLARVESDLAVHRAEDQRLVDDLVTFIDVLAEPTGLEGLELWKRNQLVRNVETLRTAVDKFAAQRVLDIAPAGHGELPTLRQSVIEVKNRSVAGTTWVWERIAHRSRTASDEFDELNAGNSETADGHSNEADPDVFDNRS